MPPSGADSATFKDIILFVCTVIKGFQFDICLISSCLRTIVRFSVCFITRLFSAVFLSFFYDAGLNERFDLNTCTTVKAIWRLSNFYWMIANTWTSHCPTKENIPHVNDTFVYMRAKECFKSEFTTWENPPFCVFLRFLPLCNAAITFFRVPLTPQTFLFCPRLLPLSAFLSSCSEECFGAVSVWGFWCFTELLWKKKKQRLHELD